MLGGNAWEERKCVCEKETECVCVEESWPRVLIAGTRRCKCDVSTNKCCKKHDSSETLPHLTHFASLLQEHGLSSIDLSSSLLLALFFISYSAPLRVGRDCHHFL